MGDAKIIITVEGAGSDSRNVSLLNFSKIVDACRKLLQDSAKIKMGEEHMCDFLVSDLSHNSPLSMAITPVGGLWGPPGTVIAEELERQVKLIASGDSDSLPDATLDRWGELVGCRGKKRANKIKMESVFSDRHLSASRKTLIFEANDKMSADIRTIKKARAVELVCVTSFIGQVELINLHGGGQIKVYPRVSEWAPVDVSFPPDKKAKVIAAIDQFAEISGEGRYRPGAPLPHKMEMDDIEVLPEADAMPKLSEMWGCMPGITGGKSVQKFLDDLREEEED